METILTKRENPTPTLTQTLKTELVKKPKSYSRRQVDQNGCWCAKSKCLKLYCACFAKGKYCGSECKCQSCHNSIGNKVRDGDFRVHWPNNSFYFFHIFSRWGLLRAELIGFSCWEEKSERKIKIWLCSNMKLFMKRILILVLLGLMIAHYAVNARDQVVSKLIVNALPEGGIVVIIASVWTARIDRSLSRPRVRAFSL